MKRQAAIVLTAVLAAMECASARGLVVRPEVSVEARVFTDDPQFQGQLDDLQLGVVLSGEASWRSKDRDTRFAFEPYLRLDSQDDRRDYFDIRELSLAHDFGRWDLLAGVSRVFWGVAESVNVVDVINQQDGLSDAGGDDRLGQPMIRASRSVGSGRFEAFLLPYFREFQFPGPSGRLRFDPVVSEDRVSYQRDGEEWAGDVALRYTIRNGSFDAGFHGFYGTSRDPFIELTEEGDAFQQRYQRSRQLGADLQFTGGALLLKAEAVYRKVDQDDFYSLVAGFEYTFTGLLRSSTDLGLIAEYLHDTRDLVASPITLFDDDIFAGARVTLNNPQDTELLAGAIVDLDTGAVQASIEYERRLGDRYLLEFEGRSFTGSGDRFIDAFEQDDFAQLRITWYF